MSQPAASLLSTTQVNTHYSYGHGLPGCTGMEIPTALQNILPAGYDHHLCEMEMDEVDSATEKSEKAVPVGFFAVLRLKLIDEEEVKRWITDFQTSSYCTWRVLQTYQYAGKKINFKKRYRCHHNTRPLKDTNRKRVTPSKNTDCQAKMGITVKNVLTERGRHRRNKADTHMPEYPTTVVLSFRHNHNIMCADALRHRDVSRETQEKLISLFKMKYTPSAALEALRTDLRAEHGDNYCMVTADRAVCPDLQYCWRLYRQTCEKKEEDVLLSLTDIAEQHNSESPSGSSPAIKVGITENGVVIVAICTLLMQRVHMFLPDSSKLCFLDAMNSADRHNHSIFLLLTHSSVGCLPIGVIVTTAKSQAIIAGALELYKSMLPESCFRGRGVAGPKMIMVNDCPNERQSLKEAFPRSQLVLSVFSILQATWRWLWDPKHGVSKEERLNHFNHMKRMVFSTSMDDINQLCADSLGDQTLNKSFKDFIAIHYQRRQEWMLAQSDYLKANLPNSFCKAAMRVLKDEIVDKTKGFSFTQLVRFLASSFPDRYQQRILDAANGRPDNDVITPRYKLKGKSFSKDNIRQVTVTDYAVTSGTKDDREYMVNTTVGHCTCPAGKTGSHCKHQAAVAKFFDVPSLNVCAPVTDQDTRALLYKIARGCDVPSKSWFAGLQPSGTSADPSAGSATNQQAPQATGKANKTDDLQATVRILSKECAKQITDAEIKQRLENMFSDLRAKLVAKPDIFRPAILAMLNQYDHNIANDAKLAGALRTFGKYPESITTTPRKKEAPTRTKEAPTRTKEAPTRTKEAPTSTKEAPTRTKEAPTSTKEAPTRTKEAPNSTKEAPTRTKETPTSTKEAPTRTKEAPMSKKRAARWSKPKGTKRPRTEQP
ncbi:uncharacterized protein [Diadema antillarum]|uniref:uncharacterized protein n=1 Tax=Diadema antillarum TaxID=105358 RepID=UPI003A899993